MGSNVTLTASDGFKLGAYRAEPQGKPKGGLVVIQEIFGVNHHIKAVCDRFAAQGYLAVAPALFDRYTPNFETGYSPAEIDVGAVYEFSIYHLMRVADPLEVFPIEIATVGMRQTVPAQG